MMTDNEINEAVARKLGWVLGLQFWNHKDKGYLLRNPPPYATDIGAAWEVVEHLRKMELSVEVKAWPMETRKAYSCHIIELCVDKHYFSEVPTAPRAICLAFLKLP